MSISEARVEPAQGEASVPDQMTLERVPWALYKRLRAIEANDRKRMTYLDGTLVILSPEYRHERGSRRIDSLIVAVTKVHGPELLGLGMTTLKRRGPRKRRGVGKEGDQAYYLGPNAEELCGLEDLRPAGDHPPPDLAVEVVNKADTPLALEVYARLGVPEFGWYDAREDTLTFLRLDAEPGRYDEIDRSIRLPMLTPALILKALANGEGKADLA